MKSLGTSALDGHDRLGKKDYTSYWLTKRAP